MEFKPVPLRLSEMTELKNAFYCQQREGKNMLNTEERLLDGNGDIEKLIGEYRQRITRAIEAEAAGIRNRASEESAEIIAKANHAFNEITGNAERQAAQMVADGKAKAKAEAETVLVQAKTAADRMVSEIAARLKAEAKEKTQKEIDRLIQDAKEQAGKYREKELAVAVAEAKQKAEHIISEAKAKAHEEESKIAAQVVNMARGKAQAEAKRINDESRKEAQRIIGLARKQVWAELERSVLLVKGAQQRLDRLADVNERRIREPDDIPVGDGQVPDGKIEALSAMETAAERDDQAPCRGRFELVIVPPVNPGEIARFEKLVKQITNLRLLGSGGSEERGCWLDVELKEAVPLLAVLKQMALVRQAVKYGESIVVSLQTTQPQP